MFDFNVRPDNASPYKVTATARDIVKWEKTNKSNSLALLQQNMHMGDLYKIAHIASVRQGFYDGSFADFEEGCDLTVLDAEDDAADPTQSAA